MNTSQSHYIQSMQACSCIPPTAELMLHKLHCIFFFFTIFTIYFTLSFSKYTHSYNLSFLRATFVSSFPLCFSTHSSHLSLPSFLQPSCSIILSVPLPTKIQVFPKKQKNKQKTFQIKSTRVTFFCMGFIYIVNIHVSGTSASVILTEMQPT